MEGSSSTGRRRSKEDIPNYKLMKKLGNGSFGQVNLATHILTGIKVAIKIFNKRLIDNSSVAVVNREINILRLFRHPHIVRFYEVIETKLNIYVVMEHVALGQLYDYIEVKGRLEEDEARRIFQQIISGVECCHRKGVIHRDLKPENLLLDSNNNVKIADFGLSNVTRDGHFFKRSCGSPNYAAPEVIAGKLYAGPEVDVWSCGVILYALLSGFLPFDDDDISRLFMKIKNGVYKLPYHLSSGAQDLITRMLIVDPIDRISIHEIQKHPWFQDKLSRNAFLHISDSAYHVNKIDDNIVQEAVKLGYNRQTVVESLQNSLQNQANVTYFLLLDNHSQVNKGDLHDELQLQLAEDEIEHPGTYLRSVPSGQQNWALGFQSESSPQRTMAGVLKILEALEVKWKKIGHYNLKCIWLPQSLVSSEITPTTALDQTDQVCSHQIFMNSGNTVFTKFQGSDLKFEIQLYKTKEKMYVLDVQKIDGPPILFLEMCAAFKAQALA